MIKRQINLSIIGTLLIAGLFWFLQFYGKEQLTSNNAISADLYQLRQSNQLLFSEYLLLRSSYYPDYDHLNQLITQHREKLSELIKSNQLNLPHHKKTLSYVKQISGIFKLEVEQLRQWQSLHSTLRNSTIYIPAAIDQIISSGYYNNELDIIDQLFKINNLFSKTNTLNIKKANNKLYQHTIKLKFIINDLHQPLPQVKNLIAHIELYTQHSPDYQTQHQRMIGLNDEISQLLNQTIDSFSLEDQAEAGFIISLTYIIFAFIIITEGVIIFYLKQTEKAILSDPKTQLPNRLGFEERVKQEYIRSNHKGGFLLLSIRKFGRINHYFSHQAGDFVLIEFSKRLKTHFQGTNAEIYRLGGDEFGILLPTAESKEQLAQAFQQLTDHVENTTFDYHGMPIHIQLAASGTLQRPFTSTASLCLNQVKKNPRINYLAYEESSGLEKEAQQKSAMLQQLRSAIISDRIEAFFQPIVGLKGQQQAKYECLLRLRKENGEYVSPFFFLDIAKEANYYAALTRIMVEKCFTYFSGKNTDFSLNLSAEDIVDETLVAWLLNQLKNNPDLCHHISFEILESEGIENFSAISNFINQVKSLGCKIAIDDFGSGYSNYENILKLNVDYIKIDGSLIKNIDTDKNCERITASIINFAHEMEIEVIVEFVHSEAVLEKVIALDADYAQGFHTGKPAAEIKTTECID